MNQGMEMKGCVCWIKKCAVDLLSMEDDLAVDQDDDSWNLVARSLQLKATFLYIDLSRVISCSETDVRKKALTDLANEFFYFMDELDNAVKSRRVSLTKVCYSDTTHVLREVVTALACGLWTNATP